MQTGLLWYDDFPGTDMDEKVRQAAQRYEKKFGEVPDVCHVHPSALDGNGKVHKVDGVRVSSRPSVLRHHFWIGCEEKARAKAGDISREMAAG